MYDRMHLVVSEPRQGSTYLWYKWNTAKECNPQVERYAPIAAQLRPYPELLHPVQMDNSDLASVACPQR